MYQYYNPSLFDSLSRPELPMRTKFVARFLLVALAVGPCLAGAADTELTSHDRPRIGLVLGGGGARGAAHIGVLKELERLRIPVDAIAGTSMGAIVGSLYAAGKSPEELEHLVETIDWEDAFVDAPSRRFLSYRRKHDDAAYPIPLELGIRNGDVMLPRGLIQGQKLQLILREEMLHVPAISNFDDLAIPFRAVASDIETGELHVMADGDLALAARASMSAPGIFAPVVVDGHTLVDGGLLGNVPVDVVREMDVDIIIAVDVEFPLYPPDHLQSALDITEQMLTVMVRRETRRQLATLGEQDILIRPDLGVHGSTNFQQIMDVIEPGAAAVRAQQSKLAALSVSRGEFDAYLARQRAGVYSPPDVEFVRVADDGPLSAGVLEARLKTEPGGPPSPVTLADDTSRLFGLNTYENVGYRLVSDGDQQGVEFETRTKSWGPNFLKFDISLEDDFEGSTAFNVATRLTMTGLNALGAEWRNDVRLGTDPGLLSEFYQPLSFDSRFFIAPRLSAEQRNFKVFGDDRGVGRYRLSEVEAGLDIGREFGQWGEFRMGVFRGAGDGRVKTGDVVLPNFDYQTGGLFARLGVDTLDDSQIPKRGTRASIEWTDARRALGAETGFDTLATRVDQVWSWGRDDRNTVRFGLEYATTREPDNQVYNNFPLGGFLRMSGLERGEISGPHAGLLRLMYYREIRNNGGGFLNLPLYLGGSLEAGNAWQNRSDVAFDSLITNGSLFAGVDTWLGLLFLGAGFSEHGESSFYLFLGNPNRSLR